MKSIYRDFLVRLAAEVSTNYAKLKCAEELSELATILIQSVTKPDRVGNNHIIAELADVELQIEQIKRVLNISESHLDNIKEHKVQDLINYKETIENFGRLPHEK